MSFQDPRMGDTPAGPGVGQRSVLKMVLQATASRQLQIEQRESRISIKLAMGNINCSWGLDLLRHPLSLDIQPDGIYIFIK